MTQHSGSQITERDRCVLAMLAEHRVTAACQLAELLEVGQRAATRRLRSLAERGLIGQQRIFSGQPAAVWITRQGLDAIERRLPPPRVDVKGYRHDLGVAWLWLAAHRGAFGELAGVISEREMRSHDGRLRTADQLERIEPYGIGIGGVGPDGLRLRHYPDLLLDTAGGRRVAVELELTSKSQHRLDSIMRGYAGDPSVDAILYLVPDAGLARRIEAAARDARIADLVHVQRIAPDGIAGAPTPAGRVSLRVAATARMGPARSGEAASRETEVGR